MNEHVRDVARALREGMSDFTSAFNMLVNGEHSAMYVFITGCLKGKGASTAALNISSRPEKGDFKRAYAAITLDSAQDGTMTHSVEWPGDSHRRVLAQAILNELNVKMTRG